MLTFVDEIPNGAWERAARFARSCFDAEGDDRPLRLARKPLEIFGAESIDPKDFHPSALVRRGLRFAVLDDKGVVAFVTVDCTGEKPEAASLEFIDEGSQMLPALELADKSASRDGERSIRVIQIPVVGARFLWVTGNCPEFVDELEVKKLDEQAFVSELVIRLHRRMENRRDHGSGLKLI